MDPADPDLAALVGLLASAVAVPTPAEFRTVVLENLRRLIPCELAVYNEISLADGSVRLVTDPPLPAEHPALRAFASYMHQHPVMAAHRRGEVGAAAISDFLTEAQLHRLPLYREVYRKFGIADQLSVALDVTPTEITAIALNRCTWGFEDRERQLLDLITPNLAQARRAAIEREQAGRDLEEALGGVEAMGHGLVTLDERGRPATWSPTAERLVREGFAAGIEPGGELPEPLAGWLAEQRAGGRPAPLESTAGGTGVTVGLIRSEAGEALLVHEREAVSPQALTTLGLPLRQAEVLAALMDGDTNQEIARRLGISARTVQKHVARVFEVLGVHTRTAAAARARAAIDEGRGPA